MGAPFRRGLPVRAAGKFWLSTAVSTAALAASGALAQAEGLWQPQVRAVVDADESGVRSALEAFLPIVQDSDTALFLDLRLTHDFDSRSSQSLGLGIRHLPNPDLMIGGYAYVHTAQQGGHRFTGATLGIEAITANFDAHVNVHLPFGKSSTTSPGGTSSTLSLVGNQLIEQISTISRRHYANWGIEGEVGVQAPIELPPGHGLRLHVGAYHFDDPDGIAGSVTGGRAGFEYTISDIFDSRASLSVGGEVRHDNTDDTSFAGFARLSIPLGPAPKRSVDADDPILPVNAQLAKRVNERVRGDIGLRIDTTDTSTSSTRSAINAATGRAFGEFFFADGGNTLGLGTIGDPTTLDDAVARANGGFVVALGGAGDILTEGVTLADGQTVIGGGASVQARLRGGGTQSFSFGGSNGHIVGTNATNDVITLGQDNTLTALTISGGAAGISGVDASGTVLRDVTVTGAGSHGAAFSGAATEVTAHNFTATGNGGSGLSIAGDGDYSFTGTTLLSGNAIDGLTIAGDGTYAFETLDTIDNLDDGIDITSASGTFSTTGGTVSGNGDVGVKIDPIELDVTLTSVSHTGGTSGIVLDDVSGSFRVTGDTSISGTTGPAIAISNSAADISFADIDIDASGGAGIVVAGANGGTIDVSGQATIHAPGGDGIDLSGASSASLSFADLSITGLAAGQTGIDLSGGTADLSIATLGVTGTGGAGSTGIDLSGTGAGTRIDIGTGTIAGVDTGVQLGVNGAAGATANATLTFGQGSIGGASAALDMRGLSAAAGAYDFGTTTFAGAQLFDAAGVVFVGSTATGVGNGTSVHDLATIDFADGLTDSGLIFVLVNDGADIVDADGFTLSAGQTLATFGSGRTFTIGGAPANVTGDNIVVGSQQDDPTGLGAATLTGSGAATIELADDSAVLDLAVSNSGPGAGIVGVGVVDVLLSGVTVSGAGGDGVRFSGTSTAAVDSLTSAGNGGAGLSIAGDGDYAFTGVTTIAGSGGDGVDLSGAASATLSFDALDIAGVSAGSTGVDLSAGRASLSVTTLSIAGTGGAGSTGIDLSATQAGTTVAIGTIDIAGVDTGVQLGSNGAGGSGANATLTIGGGQIGGATAALDTRGLSRTSGSYAFGPTVFNGPQLFDPTNIIFVAATATGTGDGSTVHDRATIDFADAITNADAIFALINDGGVIVDADGFTLSDGQLLASFGNGRTFNVDGAPINVTGVNVDTGSVVADPTGNGAATLRAATAGGTVTLADNTLVADLVLANSGAGAVLFGNGIANVAVTGVTIGESGGDAILLTNVVGDVTFADVSIGAGGFTPAGDAIRIENQQAGSTIAFTDLSLTTDQAGAIALIDADGAVTFTNVDLDHAGPGLALDVQGGAGSLTIDGGNFEARHGPGIRFDGADGVYEIDTAVRLDDTGVGSGIGLDIFGSSGRFAFADLTIVNTAPATALGTEIGFGAAGIGVDIYNSAGATTTINRLAVTAPDIALAARMGGFVSIGDAALPSVFASGFGAVAVDSEVTLVNVDIFGGNDTNPGFLVGTGGAALAPGRQYGVLAESRGLETSLSMTGGSAAGAGGFGAFNASGADLIVAVSGVALSSVSTEGFRAEATGAGQTFVTGFDDVTMLTGLGGAAFSSVTFDADPSTAGIEVVAGGATIIGSAATRVGGPGLSIVDSTGVIGFGSLSMFTNGGIGLEVLGTPGDPAALSVGVGTGTIDALGGAAMVAGSATLDASFDTVSSSGAVTAAVDLFEVSGALAIGGGSITGPVATGVLLDTVSADVTLSGMTIDSPGDYGVYIVDPVGGATTTINSTIVNAGLDAIALETTVAGSDGKIAVTGGAYSGADTGLYVAPSDPGSYEVAISGGNFTGALGGIVIDGCACAGDIVITEFGGFTVLDPGGPGTGGVIVNVAEFAVATAGGPISIGSAADPALFGLLTADVTGTLNISELNVAAAIGPAVAVDNFFQPDASTFQLTIGGGDITAEMGEALYLDTFTADITFDTVSSTDAFMSAGMLLANLSGRLEVTGAVTVTDSLDDGIYISGGGADFTFGGPVTIADAADDGIDIDGHAGTLTFGDVVIDTPGSDGIAFSGVNRTAVFGNVDITGLGAAGVGLDLFGATVDLTMASLDVTGTGGVSVGIDLRATQAGTTVNIVNGGQIGTVGTGVRLGTTGTLADTANAAFTFGGGRIEGSAASIDGRGLVAASGSYAFGTTDLVGPQLFDGGDVFFVGRVAAGTGDGSSYDNRATIADADARADAITIVLVNDGLGGGAIVDGDGFTLADGQSLVSFGNGRTIMTGGLPINVTGDNVNNGVEQQDDLGFGAATLTSGFTETITLGNGNFVADLVVSNTGGGRALSGTGVANLTGTGITIAGADTGIYLDGLTGTVTLNDTTVSATTGVGILITATAASLSFSGDTVVTNSGGDAIELAGNTGAISFGTTSVALSVGAGKAGIDFTGTNAGVTFGATTITGVSVDQTAIDFSGSDTTATFGVTTITGNASASSRGIDLSSTQNNRTITFATGSRIEGVGIGVDLSASQAIGTSANANFTFGDGEALDTNGRNSQIIAAAGNVTVNTIGLDPTLGTYDFDDVAFTGDANLLVAPNSAVFVSQAGGQITVGTFGLSQTIDTISLAAADAITAAGTVFAFVGTVDLGAAGFTLEQGQEVTGFGNGNAVSFGTIQPANVSGNLGSSGGNVTGDQSNVTGTASLLTLGGDNEIRHTRFELGGASAAGSSIFAAANLAAGNDIVIEGVTIRSVAAGRHAISLTDVASDVSVLNNDIFIDGTLVNVDGGAGILTVDAGTLPNGGATGTLRAGSIIIQNRVAGSTADFDGQVTISGAGAGAGVTLQNNSGATISFLGGLALTVSGGATGLHASGGGHVVVASSAGDENISAFLATAISLDGVSTDITFESVVGTGDGSGQSGIVLANLLQDSAFAVTGTTTLDGYATGGGADHRAIRIEDIAQDNVSIAFGAVGINLIGTNSDPAADGVRVRNITGAGMDIDFGALAFGRTGTVQQFDLAFEVENVAAMAAGFTLDVASLDLVNVSRGLQIDNADAGTFTFGTFDLAAGATSSAAIRIANSSADFAFNGDLDIASSMGTGINLTSNDGTFDFSGASKKISTGSGIGVELVTNLGADISFTNGGLDIVTTSGTGWWSTGVGGSYDLAVTGAGNSIRTGTGNIMRMTQADLAAGAGVEFDLLQSTGASLGESVVLSAVNGAGEFSVTTLNIAGTGGGSHGLDVASSSADFVFDTVAITNTSGSGVSINNVGGDIAINGGTIAGSAGGEIGVDINAGSGDISLAADIAKSTAGALIEITARSGGTVTFSGNLSASGASGGIDVNANTGGSIVFSGATKTLNTSATAAVSLANNTGATISFTGGGLDIDTTSETGFNATGGGTINVSGPNNSITAGAGTALNLDGVAIGASNIAFASITKAGAGTGIALDDISGTGTVSIAAANLSGITTTGASLSGTIAANVAFTDLDISLAGGTAVAFSANGATVGGTVSAGDFDVTNAGAADTTIGVDLRGATGAGLVRLGDTVIGGANATIAGVQTGVFFNNATNLDFVYGDGEATDTGSTISAVTPIDATSAPNPAATYNFLDVNFTGSPGAGFGVGRIFFVAATQTGDFSGRDAANRANIGLATLGTEVDDIIVLIEDGGMINAGVRAGNTLSLADGAQVRGFGDGAINLALTIPAGIQLAKTAIEITDPTSGGAATLTSNAGQNAITLGANGNTIDGFILDGSPLSAGRGVAGLTGATGTTISNMTVRNFATRGIEITPSANTTIDQVTFSGNADDILLNAAGSVLTNITSSGATGTSITLTNATGTTTLKNIAITGAANGLAFNNAGGTIDADNIDISAANALTITGGAGAFDFDAASSIVNTTGTAVRIQNRSGGSFTYNGTVGSNGAANGINVSGATGANTVSFTGTVDLGVGTTLTGTAISLASANTTVSFANLDIVTNGTTGFTATGGGTVNVATGTVSSTGAGAISLDGQTAGINFTSFSSTGGTNNVSLTNVSGTVNLGAGALSGATGSAFVVSGGSASIDYNGSITHSANAVAISVQNHTGTAGGGSTISFDGAITSNVNSDGIVLVNNGGTNGTTIRFTNTLSLNTSASNTTAFSATGGGTVTATGAGSTINSGAGTALNVVSTNIGAAGLTFQSISANGGANGIVLNNTGTTAGVHGGLTVTGAGAANSGGVIQNMTGADDAGAAPGGTGIVLNNTRGVSLSRMHLHDFSNYAIRGTGVVDFVLADSTINGVSGTNVSSPFRDSAVRFDNLTGTVNILRNEITGGRQHNVLIDNQSGTMNLNFLQNNVHHTSATDGDDGFQLEAELTARVTANVSNNTFTAHGGDHFNLSLINDANVDLTFNGNDMQGGHAIGLGQGVFISGGSFNGQLRYDISNNGTLIDPFVGNSQGGAIHVSKGSGTGTFNGQIINNVIGDPAVTGSGSSHASGIIVGARGAGGSHTTLIQGNQIREFFDRGIVAEVGEGSPTMNLTVTNNSVSDFADAVNSLHGIHFAFGILAGDNATVRIDVRNNLIADAGNEAMGGADFRMRVASNVGVFIAGYSGGNSSANAQAFIDAQNPDGTSFLVSQAGSGTYNNLAAGGVPAPTLPTLPPAPLMAAPGSAGDGLWAGELSGDTLDAMIAAAIERWALTGISDEQVAALNTTTFEIADLGGSYLAMADGNAIRIDNDAAGNGWFVDLTPLDDEEFANGGGTQLFAASESELAGQYDLLTTIMHELGHVLGHVDTYTIKDGARLMYGWLSPGERRLPDMIAREPSLETAALGD